MSIQKFTFHGIIAAAIAAVSLSQPLMTAAQAAQSGAYRSNSQQVRIFDTTRDPATATGGSLTPYSAPAANEINSTYPEGMSTYSGGNGS